MDTWDDVETIRLDKVMMIYFALVLATLVLERVWVGRTGTMRMTEVKSWRTTLMSIMFRVKVFMSRLYHL